MQILFIDSHAEAKIAVEIAKDEFNYEYDESDFYKRYTHNTLDHCADKHALGDRIADSIKARRARIAAERGLARHRGQKAATEDEVLRAAALAGIPASFAEVAVHNYDLERCSTPGVVNAMLVDYRDRKS